MSQLALVPIVAALFFAAVPAFAQQDGAEAQAREALVQAEANGDRAPLQLADALLWLSQSLKSQRKLEEAERLLRRAITLLRQKAPDDTERLHTTLFELAETMRISGRTQEGEAFSREALAFRSIPSGDRADSLIQLAVILNDAERFVDAEPLAREGLKLREALLGPSHARTWNARRQIARALAGRGKLNEAEPIYRAVYLARRSANDPEALSDSAQELGSHLISMGRHADAEKVMRETLRSLETPASTEDYVEWLRAELGTALVKLRRDAEGEALLNMAITKLDDGSEERTGELEYYFHMRAIALDFLNRDAEAEPLYRRVLKSLEARLGPTHYEVALTLTHLGTCLIDLHRSTEAAVDLRRAIHIFEAGGETGGSLATALEGLAVALSRVSAANNNEILALLNRALALRGGEGAQDIGVARTLWKLADVHFMAGQEEPAIRNFERAMALARIVEGDAGPTALKILKAFIDMSRDLGRYTDAERLAREQLAVRERLAEPKATAGAAITLAFVLLQQAKMEAAIAMSRYASALLKSAGGGEGLEASNALIILAESNQQRGRLTEAESQYRRALAIEEKLLDPKDRNIAATLRLLATNLMLQQRYSEAETQLRRARDIFVVYGAEDGNVGWVTVALADVLGKLRRHEEAEQSYRVALRIYDRAFASDHPGRLEPLVSYGRYALLEQKPQLALTLTRKAAPIALKRAARSGLDTAARDEFQRNRAVFALHVSAAWKLASVARN